MKVAYLVSSDDHAHCYGVDNLFTGLVNVLGFGNVLDWPEKAPLHCVPDEHGNPIRDACQIDSDQCFPRRGHDASQLLDADIALIALSPYAADAQRVAAICAALPKSTPIAAIDASDRVSNCGGWYEQIAGRSLAAYFKRELPIGADWGAVPLPLMYPASRVPADLWKCKRLFALYVATSHNGGAPGIPRLAITDALAAHARAERWVVIENADGLERSLIAAPPKLGWTLDAHDGLPPASVPSLHVKLTRGQSQRPTPEEYHDALRTALIGISWNGALNQDNNRFWENFAFGLCQVAERPRIQIPNPPRDGVHCFYVDTHEAVAPLVWALLHDEDTARHVTMNGHAHFLTYHSAEARARYVLEMVGR